MMHANVLISDPHGVVHELVPGDLIGRLHTAALHIDDGRVSEAHAMVSLRDGALRLMGLRGAFAVEGRTYDDLELREGQRIQLAPGVEIAVMLVTLPSAVLGVEAPGVARRALPGVCSVIPGPRLVSGWQTGALAWIWSTGGSFSVRDASGTRALSPGDSLLGLRVVLILLENAGQDATRQGGLNSPLLLIANYDTVHIHRDGRVVVSLPGVLARIVSELVLLGGPAPWTVLAREVWPDASDDGVARVRLDANLSRIRRKLRAASVRDDLIHTDGSGQIELLLYPGDRVEDRT